MQHCSSFLHLIRRLAGVRHHRGRNTAAKPASGDPPPPTSSLPLDRLYGRTVVVDVEAWLLRPPVHAFTYFMVVAVEAGGFLRGLLLLLLYPLLCAFLGDGRGGARGRAMATVALIGLEEEEVARVGRAVLPRFFLEAAAAEGVEAVRAARRSVAVSATFPRVMVEAFLREHVGVDAVVGPELRSVAGVVAGLVDEGDAAEVAARRLRALLGDETEEGKQGGAAAVGLVGEGRSGGTVHHLFSRYYCKETFTASEADKRRPLPPGKCGVEPLVFHDGRLAFPPTPSAALAMYAYLPFGVALAVSRVVALSLLPYRVTFLVGAATGVHYRLVAGPRHHAPDADGAAVAGGGGGGGGGRLYVCNHRTLLDPVVVATALGKPVTAVTYSLSRVSEMIAPIRTARLTRNRERDRRDMAALLARGDLVVCPEGTTCREGYLLRFSPLFAELGADVNPVALDTSVDMFYGTSTTPAAKWMDPFYFMMNPKPSYRVEFLPRAAAVAAAAEDGDDRRCSSIRVANRVQRQIGEALGFELTGMTRKDKYMMLAGNEGAVAAAAIKAKK
ncbi:probable glycerol-3-phosphate acyltransferase 3 [Oryza brachyantha]|uniref:probable glycerol-3-phosphate acyltransferase 3 n=1 Tax=Oryza brachyantha TaxID=4533 RepID=UPI001ADBF66F|nr:probable glycerol-3-phosphate acyltransferase 3 [Oryza brachyantha]